jgi:hypothetical protein
MSYYDDDTDLDFDTDYDLLDSEEREMEDQDNADDRIASIEDEWADSAYVDDDDDAERDCCD